MLKSSAVVDQPDQRETDRLERNGALMPGHRETVEDILKGAGIIVGFRSR